MAGDDGLEEAARTMEHSEEGGCEGVLDVLRSYISKGFMDYLCR